MNKLKYFMLTFALFTFCMFNVKAFTASTDYDFKIKEVQFPQNVKTSLKNPSGIFKVIGDKIELYPLCKYKFIGTVACVNSSLDDVDISDKDAQCIYAHYYDAYKNDNAAYIVLADTGNSYVLVDSGNYSLNEQSGTYIISSKDSFNNLKKGVEEFQGGDSEAISNYKKYGWCPDTITVNPGSDNDKDHADYDGYIYFDNGAKQKLYGRAVYDTWQRDICPNLSCFKKESDGRNRYTGAYSHVNDIFQSVYYFDKSNSMDAFSKEDKEYTDSLIYDLEHLSSDTSFCDFSSTNNKSYTNMIKILDYIAYLRKLRRENLDAVSSIDDLLQNNNYVSKSDNGGTSLVDSIVQNLAPGTTCYSSEFASQDNSLKYEQLYDKAKSIKDGSKFDPNQNTVDTCEKLLGSPDNKEDVAYYIQTILNFVKILGPILIIALSIYDYVKAIPSGDRDAINKVNKKTIIRVVAGVFIFFAPILIKSLFTLLGIYSDSDCNIG